MSAQNNLSSFIGSVADLPRGAVRSGWHLAFLFSVAVALATSGCSHRSSSPVHPGDCSEVFVLKGRTLILYESGYAEYVDEDGWLPCMST